VKEKGASDATGHTRTPAESAVGRFYSDAPANYWNRLMRDFVVDRSLNLGDSARNVRAGQHGDGGCDYLCVGHQIFYNVWRPVTAIQQGDLDGNPATAGNPTWTSFFARRTIPTTRRARTTCPVRRRRSSSTCSVTKWTSPLFSNAAGAVRGSTRVSRTSRATSSTRGIFMGIHFRFADSTALRQGTHVANWTVVTTCGRRRRQVILPRGGRRTR
jgi:hypothetical protein